MTNTPLSVDAQMELLMRGVEYGDPNLRQTMEQELRERLAEGRPLRVYQGFDPTATDLHLGNMVGMLKLRQFQQLGHEHRQAASLRRRQDYYRDIHHGL